MLDSQHPPYLQANTMHFRTFFHAMLDAGIYFAPSPYETGFVSSRHGASVVHGTLHAAQQAFARLACIN